MPQTRSYCVNLLEGVINDKGKIAVLSNEGFVEIIDVKKSKSAVISETRVASIDLKGGVLLSVSWSPAHVLPGCLLVLKGDVLQIWRVNGATPVLLREIPHDPNLRVYDARWGFMAIPSVYLFHKCGIIYIELPRSVAENRAELALTPFVSDRVREFAIHHRSLNCAVPIPQGYLVGTSVGETIRDGQVLARLKDATPVASGSPGRENRRRSADPFLVGNFCESISSGESFSVHPLIVRSNSSSDKAQGNVSTKKKANQSLLTAGSDSKRYSTRAVCYLEDADVCFSALEEADTVLLSSASNADRGSSLGAGAGERQSVFEVLKSVGNRGQAGILPQDVSSSGAGESGSGRVRVAFLGAHGDEIHRDFNDPLMTLTMDDKETPSAEALSKVSDLKLLRMWRSQVGPNGADGAEDTRMQVDTLEPFYDIATPAVTSPDVLACFKKDMMAGVLAIGSSTAGVVRLADYDLSKKQPLALRQEMIELSPGHRCKGLAFVEALSPTSAGDAVLLMTTGVQDKAAAPVNLSTHSSVTLSRRYEVVRIVSPNQSKMSSLSIAKAPTASVEIKAHKSVRNDQRMASEQLSALMDAVKDVQGNMETISRDFRDRMTQAEDQLSQITNLLSTLVSQQR